MHVYMCILVIIPYSGLFRGTKFSRFSRLTLEPRKFSTSTSKITRYTVSEVYTFIVFPYLCVVPLKYVRTFLCSLIGGDKKRKSRQTEKYRSCISRQVFNIVLFRLTVYIF